MLAVRKATAEAVSTCTPRSAATALDALSASWRTKSYTLTEVAGGRFGASVSSTSTAALAAVMCSFSRQPGS